MATKLSKNDMLILDYVQILIIGQAIQVTKVNQNAKKKKKKKMAAKLSKNEMLVFGLCSTSDGQPSYPSDESQPKCEKLAAKLSKIEMLILDYVQLLMISQVI